MSKARKDYYQFKAVCDKYFEGIKREINEYIEELEAKTFNASEIKELLEDYTRWLNDCGYTDDDTWCEEPTAVNRFLIEELPETKNAVIIEFLKKITG